MDFNQYKSQIKALVSLRKEPDFNDIFNKTFANESNSDKFLIKMEINRLTQPCIRIIDLRDKITDETQLFTHKKIAHYLTASAIVVFKEAIKIYGGYTTGVYEMVFAHVQDQKSKQQHNIINTTTKDNENLTESIQLNSHKTRANARMFFISPIVIMLPDGTELKASTSNISISGLKIKLPESIPCFKGDLIEVAFTGLRSEIKHKSIDEDNIKYRLISQEEENETFYFHLSIEPEQQEFISFIKGFIRGNQYKYKIDVQYYFNIARENALKNSALRAMNTLPIYLNANSHAPALFMLQNEVTKNIVDDWHYNESNQLAYLFSETRLAELLSVAQNKQATTLYTFSEVHDDVEYLLSATEEELNKANIKKRFIQYGQSKDSWHCYHLSLKPYTYQENKRYEITSVQPDSFAKITHIATLTELNTHEIILHEPRSEKLDLSTLTQFIHRDVSLPAVPIYHLFPDEMRKEERYGYVSAIKLRVDGYSCTGHIIDFSYSGLKVKLDQIPILTKRSIVKIDFIDLQKVSNKFRLMGIQYRAIASSPGNIYHLQVTSRESFQSIQKFFSLLVKNNPNHFTVLPLNAPKQPVTARLHEVAEPALEQAFFFVTTGSGKPKLTYSAIASDSNSLKSIFELNCNSAKEHNYIALSNNNLLERILYNPLRNAPSQGVNIERTIYIKKIRTEENNWSITSYLDEDFSSEDRRKQFILAQKKLGQLQILHYRLSTITAPDLNVIKSEIAIISRHAVHLGKRIQEVLLGMGAMIEVIDRTEHIIGIINEQENK